MPERVWRASLVMTMATLVLTVAHHVYGGVVYDTPWRIHGMALGVLGLAAAALAYRRRSRPVWARAYLGVSAGLFGVVVGLFEGGYNHVLKGAGPGHPCPAVPAAPVRRPRRRLLRGDRRAPVAARSRGDHARRGALDDAARRRAGHLRAQAREAVQAAMIWSLRSNMTFFSAGSAWSWPSRCSRPWMSR